MRQEMQNQSQPSYGYEGERTPDAPSYYVPGQKLLVPVSGHAPSPGQRLALAIVSLSLLIFLIFGLISLASAENAPNWAVIPILFVMLLFSAVATAINFMFNRRV
ncbi:MAG TPA: hypothetical protein VGD98_14580 [Ktedonobacteraceae bacterium]